jgi:hypothetical protein
LLTVNVNLINHSDFYPKTKNEFFIKGQKFSFQNILAGKLSFKRIEVITELILLIQASNSME